MSKRKKQSKRVVPCHEGMYWEKRYSSTCTQPWDWTEVNGQLHTPGASHPVRKSTTHWVGCCVALRTSLDNLKK